MHTRTCTHTYMHTHRYTGSGVSFMHQLKSELPRLSSTGLCSVPVVVNFHCQLARVSGYLDPLLGISVREFSDFN